VKYGGRAVSHGLGGMEDRKVMAVIAIWWCHRREMQGRVIE